MKSMSGHSTHPQDYAAQHAERFVAELREACRIPSISTSGDPGLQEMADWLHVRLGDILDEVEQIPVPGAAPAVVGRLQGTGPYTVLMYSHYDVQPTGPRAEWSVDPFGAEIVDGSVVARGVCDDKSDVLARLHALESIVRSGRRPACSIVWLCEGAEEIGSPGLGELLTEHRDRFAADACLWESYLRRDDGRPEIGFGSRGLVYVEITLRRLALDQHSAFATVFRSAPAELTRALAAMVDERGRVVIDGFHDDVRPLDEHARRALETIEVPDDSAAALPGGPDPFITRDRAELARRLVAEPTANIAGLSAGHTGPGKMTVLPAQASAKVDFRLVPDQRPDRIVELLRAHLDRHGLHDAEVVVESAIAPAVSPMDFPLADAVIRAARERFGEPVIYPIVPGAGPASDMVGALGLPLVMAPGSTRMESGIHAPDEHARVDDYLAQVAFTIRWLELLEDTPA
jgi:acetylornithine deacetylase/succinyl-diaminopimelate desuccinylase-like protein